MRVCLVYDCLYPYTVGGAERWYRSLARRLAEQGHEVTYLTLRQWPQGESPDLPGVSVVSVGPGMALYAGGRRRIGPPLLFGLGVLRHLATHGSRYDVVHTASFPYFSVLAAGAARLRHRFRLLVDWHEVWTREYWREYLGRLGDVGWAVQKLCLRLPQRAICFSRLHEERLRAAGVKGPILLVRGQYDGPLDPPAPVPAEPVVVFAGRHIAEKRVLSLVPALAKARERIPDLRLEIFGDGPERPRLLRLIADSGLADVVRAPGFVPAAELERSLARALCLVLPSRREGYGQVVVQATAFGVPCAVVSGPDNAAASLISPGVNGFLVPSASPEDLAAAILKIWKLGPMLRETTRSWFEHHAGVLSIDQSIAAVLELYSR
jgi:glycosyltransferase involved in cell wall biosynthesis